MPILERPDMKAAVPKGKALVGLDLGAKTIGVAVSDVSQMIATPRETIQRRKLRDDLARLRDIIESSSVGGLIVGLPVGMDGTEGPRCQSVRDLTKEIVNQLSLPAAFWDERLSTAAVERVLIGEGDVSRVKRSAVVDKMAAAWILQGYLDAS